MQSKHILFCAFLLLVPLGCSKKEQSLSERRPLNNDASQNVSEVIQVSPRSNLVPNFSWKDKAGKDVDFNSYRGKVTLINFWATWCGPCKKEIPDLVSLSQEMSSKGVKVIGVSTDRGSSAPNDVSEFVAQHDIPYLVIISNEDLERAFGNVNRIPTSFVIDHDGKIVKTIEGPRSKEAFLQIINPLL